MNALEGNIHNFEHGFLLFLTGAIAGEASLYSGPIAPYVSAGILGFGNSCLNQSYNNGSINWDSVLLDVGMSELMAGFTSALGDIMPPIADNMTKNIKSPILHDIAKNSINSSIGGASIGFLFGWADEDANFGDALKNSAKGFEFGIINGIISGTSSGLSRAFHEHVNPWTGSHISKDVINNSIPHVHAHNRHDNLGLGKDIINSKLLNLIDQNYNNYHEGDNTFVVKVNGIDKILRVHLNNGTISSFNFMNWNGNKPRSATPVRNLPNQWW